MALEMRSACERCSAELPAASTDARICSFECTFGIPWMVNAEAAQAP
jgi:hypothetical protein